MAGKKTKFFLFSALAAAAAGLLALLMIKKNKDNSFWK